MGNWLEFESGEIKISTGIGQEEEIYHQYGGTACYHFTTTSELVTLGFTDSKYFSTEWWYSCYYRKDRKEREYVVPLPYKERAGGITLEKELRNHPDKLYLDTDLKSILEKELNQLNPDYQNFSINGKIYEALLFVFYDYKGKRQFGYVVWENCD